MSVKATFTISQGEPRDRRLKPLVVKKKLYISNQREIWTFRFHPRNSNVFNNLNKTENLDKHGHFGKAGRMILQLKRCYVNIIMSG